jgi:uncharacterized protein (TIGR04255 family)
LSYQRAPIVEAVLEFQFETEVSIEAIGKAASKLVSTYPHDETEMIFEASFDTASRRTAMKESTLGRKLSSEDRAKIVLARRKSLGFAELAPYPGWAEFSGRAKDGWQVWQRVVGNHKISRIGVRYINRIDIPQREKTDLIDPKQFVTIGLDIPEIGPSHTIENYTLQVRKKLGVDDLEVVINTGLVDPPVPKSISILLDIDLSTTIDIPRREDQLWEKMDVMRNHKNAIFEACITDDARALFSR